ncbi:MAG: hypothetical protein IJI27_08065 [Oscillospiraceae bacterium]|nr:hypothetical protein [Oscillospiraceae bacterium]
MKAITATQKGQTASGKRVMDVFLLSDDDPQTLPTTGEGIGGLREDDVFAPFSILFVLSGPKTYIANESGVFTSV